jgi:hypothetical protein
VQQASAPLLSHSQVTVASPTAEDEDKNHDWKEQIRDLAVGPWADADDEKRAALLKMITTKNTMGSLNKTVLTKISY